MDFVARGVYSWALISGLDDHLDVFCDVELPETGLEDRALGASGMLISTD